MDDQRHVPVHYYPQLDALRGILAFSVLLSHYLKAYEAPWPFTEATFINPSIFHFFLEGDSAVCCFFVLSGFVLSIRSFKPGATPPRLWPNFLIARLFRIYPAYLFCLLLGGLIYWLTTTFGLLGLQTIPPQGAWTKALWLESIHIKDVLLEMNLFAMADRITILPQSWSLSVEIVLSMLIPFGVIITQRSRWLLIALVLGLVMIGGSRFLIHFAFGVLVAQDLSSLKAFMQKSAWRRWIMATISITSLLTGEYFLAGPLRLSPGMVSGLGATLLLIFALTSRSFEKVMSHRGLVFLGKVSYSLYLTHFMVVIALTPLFLKWLSMPLQQRAWAWWLGLFFTSGLSLLLSFAIQRWIEQPGILAGKRLTARINPLKDISFLEHSA